MELIVHYPKTPEKQAELDHLVAKVHAQYVLGYIEKLDCPTEQKLKLVDAIVKTISDSCKHKAGD
ncbi:hypothetical protein B5F94_00435 [Flavonifractor sp. An4]|nr:hypothetical protein B5F94_00435 [Flavonifractor sp. An4]